MVRFKNRYAVCDVSSFHTSKGILDCSDIYNWISKTVEQIHGEFGLAAVRPGLSVKYCNPDTKICIIRARHGPHKLLAGALPFAANFQNSKMQIRTLYIGASLSCCYKFLQKHQRSQLDAVWNKLEPAERQKLEESILNSNITKFMQDVS